MPVVILMYQEICHSYTEIEKVFKKEIKLAVILPAAF